MSVFGRGLGLTFGGVPPLAVATGVPVNTAAPAVTGIQTVGQVLTTTTGAWTQYPTSYAYKWQSSADGSTGWADVSGATASTYTPVSGDATKYLRSAVQASNSFGPDAAGYVASAAVGPIAAVLSISGTPATTATVGVAYSFTPSTAGGHTPKTFSITNKPAWATFSTSTGQLTGTPSAVETDSGIIITVADADGLTASLASFAITVSVSGTSYAVLTSGSTWTAPANLTAVTKVEVIGPGGNGANSLAANYSGGGGGGGAYAYVNNPANIVANDVINIRVGAGGSGNSTYLKNNTNTTIVEAGAGANGSTNTGGAGGAVVTGTGAAGGTGGNGQASASNHTGGGGAGAGGPHGVGAAGGLGANASGNGGGGGGADGGSAGATAVAGGAGGNNYLGTGGGASGASPTAGTAGGGGGGSDGGATAGAGGASTALADGATGPGGGGGGAGSWTGAGGAGGNYGGGGGGAGGDGGSQGSGGAGKPGVIVIAYTHS